MLTHFVHNLGLSPEGIHRCVASYERADNYTAWWNSTDFPSECRVGFRPNKHKVKGRGDETVFNRLDEDGMPLPDVNIALMKETANSYLFRALWNLPSECRVHTFENFDLDGLQVNCFSELDLGMLLVNALADQAGLLVGCNRNNFFAAEHLWPQQIHYHSAGRVDAAMRVETLLDDASRVEALIESRLGKPLPPAQPGCSLSEINTNDVSQVAKVLVNRSRLASALARSSDLQRRLCALYYHDFACHDYELLPACKAPATTWMEGSMRALLTNAPIEWDQPPSAKSSVVQLRDHPLRRVEFVCANSTEGVRCRVRAVERDGTVIGTPEQALAGDLLQRARTQSGDASSEAEDARAAMAAATANQDAATAATKQAVEAMQAASLQPEDYFRDRR